MDFQTTVEKMWDFYKDTERRLIQTSHSIPLDNNYSTYSIEFYNILQSTCGQVENMARVLCEELNLKYSRKKFVEYFPLLNSNQVLTYQNVYIAKLNESIKPFITHSKPLPEWWHNYNNTKHKLPEGIKQGNIGNTLHALAGLFNLHHIAHYVKHEPNLEKILRQTEWVQRGDGYLDEEFYRSSFWSLPFPKSDVFVCTTSLGTPI